MKDVKAAPSTQDSREKVWDLIKDIRFAMLVTQDSEGHMYSRPMAAQKRDEHDQLWFFTSADSPKVAEIINNPNILLSYAEPSENNFVSVSGEAHIVKNTAKIKELWTENLKAWFPKGQEDPNIALIEVTPKSAEYWDAPSSTFVQAFGYLKAKMTGKPENLGENKTVRL